MEFNGLTNSEAERLYLLLEEFGECQHIIGKILRHGYESTNPVTGDGVSNRELLTRELSDVLAAISRVSANDVDYIRVNELAIHRYYTQKYLHHQE